MSGERLHLVGIGGAGMCGLAEVLAGSGFAVSGCDAAASERTAHLERLGIDVRLGHSPDHVSGVEALVVTSAVGRSEAEVERARALGVPVVRRAEMLGELMRGRRGVAVAGTHGKTTTTALTGHLLIAAGLDPTVIVGGRALGLGGHARVGAGELMVCEADEFDRSFLELNPELAVVTNLEAEHLDCYADLDDLADAFVAFGNRCAALGLVAVCVDDPGARALVARLRRRVLGYGLGADAVLRADGIVTSVSGSEFEVRRRGQILGRFRVPVPGLHNVRNALGAIAMALELGIDVATMAAACASFPGVARRFERRGERGGVVVVDDYAHHPTEVRAVLAAARQALPERRLVAVFQPHLYSRTRDFAEDFGAALTAADVAIVLPVYPAREQPIDGVGAGLVVEAATRAGHPAIHAGPPVAEAASFLDELLRPGDVLLTLGAGDVDRVASAWLEGGCR